jgi:hypothetical protein
LSAAACLLQTARAAGLSLAACDDKLVIEADVDPPPELLAELRQWKGELLALLRRSPADDPEERAAIIAEGAGVPRAWAESYAALCTMPPPSGFSRERWQRVIDVIGAFLDRWAGEAIRCGWSDLDVFGAHERAPAARFDCMGLVLLLDRCEVIAIDRDGADLVTAAGVHQRFRRRELPPGTVSLWELVRR